MPKYDSMDSRQCLSRNKRTVKLHFNKLAGILRDKIIDVHPPIKIYKFTTFVDYNSV